MHNAITNINNSFMQLEIILIGITHSELLFSEHFCNFFEYYFFQRGGLGEHCKFPQWGPGRSPESQCTFRFYIASKVNKNIIWLINL